MEMVEAGKAWCPGTSQGTAGDTSGGACGVVGRSWTLNTLQALLSQSCPVMTAFWKHAAVCVLMPPCRWERTRWENRAESGGRFVLTQDSGCLLKALASNKPAERIAGLRRVGPGTLDSGCVQGLVAPLGPWQGCCSAHPLLPGALGQLHSHITWLMPGE